MLKELYGYEVSEAELQEYLANLQLPTYDVEIKKQNDLFEVYCNGTLLYYSEIEVKDDEEKERLEDCWLLEQAQIHFADRQIMPAPEPEPVPELTDSELIKETHDLMLEQNINSEYIASLIELGI